jgi:hypothetical protein
VSGWVKTTKLGKTTIFNECANQKLAEQLQLSTTICPPCIATY